MATLSEVDSATKLIGNVLEGFRRSDRTNHNCVLFVHGLTGHIKETWTKKNSKEGFIELILRDPGLTDYDVFSFGYRTTYLRGAPIDSAARQLGDAVDRLMAERPYSIVLVAHSMGGLVCMRYILNQLEAGRIPPISGLLLYGTPTTGSELMNAARLVGFGIGAWLPFFRLVNAFLQSQRQVTDLAAGSEFLSRLHDGWALRIVNGGHESAGQHRMWLPVRVVTGEDDRFVSEMSGKGVYGAIDWRSLSYTHVQLVKPTAINDDRFLVAQSFLQICRRAKDREILDRIWHASQRVWALRVGRVTEKLKYQTFINHPPEPGDQGDQLPLGFARCRTDCEYDFVLEGTEVEFGVAIGEYTRREVWDRFPQPVCVHQIGLRLLPSSNLTGFKSTLDTILSGSEASDLVWSRLFPQADLYIDDEPLVAGSIIWQSNPRWYSNWALRSYSLPAKSRSKIGDKVRLKICYRSFVPSSLGLFSFSSPWVVKEAQVRALVYGKMDYFSASHRGSQRGETELEETPAPPDRHDVTFTHRGVMLPDTTMEVRWQLADRTHQGA